MTVAQMFGQSGVLMLLGMSVVFGFLIILIIAVTLAGRVVHALGLDRLSLQEAAPQPQAARPAGGIDGATVAAISAAVSTYRKEQERK